MTLREIARRANVSIATASRAINRVPTVKPVLARRVQRVIEKVGYYPNTHARALVSGRSRAFGLIVSEIINPFFPEIVQTFTKLGVKHNYEMLVTPVGQDSCLREMAARQMIERRVGGVAVLTFGAVDALIDVFSRRNVPVFAVDIDNPGPFLKSVHVDYQHGIRQAVQHPAALGHVRIGFIGGPAHLKTATRRKLAFQECMKEIGLEVRSQLEVEGDHTLEGGMKAASVLATLPDRPSAVVCSNDMTAIGVMGEVFDLSLSIPHDLSIIGFDDIRLGQFMTPPLTTVQLSLTEIANLAFAALLDSVEPQPNGSSRHPCTIETNLVLRSSTALTPDRSGQRLGTRSPGTPR